MRFHDDITPTAEAAADFEAGRAYQQSRRELAEEAGYNDADDTLGTHIPLTDPAAFERACQGARATRAAAEERDRAWRRAREAS